MNLKKSLVVALVFSTGLSAHAKVDAAANEKASVRIPVILGDGNGEILKASLAEINKQLADKQMESLPSYIEISTEDKNPYKIISTVKEKASASLVALGYQYGGLASQYVPGDLDAKAGVTTCYTGNALKVPDLLSNGTDVVYSDQLSLIGYKYKSKKVLAVDLEGEELKDLENTLNEESAAWKNYDKKSDTILLLHSVGDDGTDVNDSVIPKCK